jgi:hypothetical protein
MARTAITVQEITRGTPLTDLTWTAASAANDHYFINSGREILLTKNGDASPHTITVVSVTDGFARTGDHSLVTGASDNCADGFFLPEVWNQRGASELGQVHIDIGSGEDTSMYLAVIRPAS